MKTEERRRIPVEEEWFDKNLNSIIYGFLQANALKNNNPTDSQKILYYPKKQVKNDLSILKKLLDKKDNRSIYAQINKLIEKNYLSEDVDNYYFPYNEKNLYFLMDKNLLICLVYRTNNVALKIFVYLAFKSKSQKGFRFTLKSLQKLIGFSENTRGHGEKLVRESLETLANNKFILFHTDYVTSSDAKHIVPNYVLDYVTSKAPDILLTQPEAGVKKK